MIQSNDQIIASLSENELQSLRKRLNLELRESCYDEPKLRKRKTAPRYIKATGLSRLAFHKGGKPRGWLSSVIKGKDGFRPNAEFIWKKDGKVKDRFEKWVEDNSPELQMTYRSRIKHYIESGKPRNIKKIHIIHTHHAKYVADELVSSLSGLGFVVSVSTQYYSYYDADLYFVVSPNAFKSLPPSDRMISIQLEQVSASRWMSEDYISTLQASLAVIDYSQYNIRDLVRLGLDSSQIYFCPIFPNRFKGASEERDIDVLFYGDVSSPRRSYILEELSKKYNIVSYSNLFGKDMSSALSRAKVVLNIHYYENAILETIRLSEAISHGCSVVSERALDQNMHGYFESHVRFSNIGDVDDLAGKIEEALRCFDEQDVPRPHLNTKFHVLRCLLGLDIIDFDTFCRETISEVPSSTRYCLGLPEQYHRYKYANINLLPGATIFHGLRKIDGWKGCALSYKYLATLAIHNGLNQMLIYEDDAEFYDYSIGMLEASERYLSQLDKKWEVFSGIVTDLHQDAAVLDVEKFEDQQFVFIDKPVGMVFMIYSAIGISRMSNYEIMGENTMIHTIDRYMENGNFTCVTSTRPLCMHADFFDSSIWGTTNQSMTGMIQRSISNLRMRVDDYVRNSH